MNYSMRDLLNLLRGNPDLHIDDAYIHSPILGLAQAVPVFKATERDLQQAVIDECDRRAVTKPAYGYIFCVPNGMYRAGQRAEPGLRAGVPDLVLPIMRHGYGALFLELKISPNKPSQLQREWVDNLRAQGYFCGVIWDSLDEVMTVLEWYIEGK